MIKHKFWSPVKEIVDYNISLCKDKQHILELGPGYRKFPAANYFIDNDETHLDDELKHIYMNIDLDTTDIPPPISSDKYDFCYARHIFEDIQNPDFVFRNMLKVCHMGYIETPSPLVECLKDIDGATGIPYRGYIHHRYIIWTENDNELHIIPKLPIIEHITFTPDFEKFCYDTANSGPLFWNNYFWWDTTTQYHCIVHKHFEIINEYGNLLKRAILSSIEHTRKNEYKVNMTI